MTIAKGRDWARRADPEAVLDVYQLHLCSSKDPRFDWVAVRGDLPPEAVDLDPADFVYGVASYVRDQVTPPRR